MEVSTAGILSFNYQLGWMLGDFFQHATFDYRMAIAVNTVTW
jgi:hypothetical protein